MTYSLGQRIERARTAAGLSMDDVGKGLGIRRTTIQKWESGKLLPRSNNLQKLSGLLNVSLVWLLSGNAPEGSALRSARDERRSASESLSDKSEIFRKLHRAMEMQQESAALLADVSISVQRLTC